MLTKADVLLTPEESIGANMEDDMLAQCRKLLAIFDSRCPHYLGGFGGPAATRGGCPACMAEIREALK